MTDISIIHCGQLIAVTDDGRVCEITNLFDADGDDTDDITLAVSAVIRVSDDEWHTVLLDDYEHTQVN